MDNDILKQILGELKNINGRLERVEDAQGMMQVDMKSMQSDMKSMQSDMKSMQVDIRSLKEDVKKNTVAIEDMDVRLKEIAEVQQVNYAENEKHHREIVEMLTERLDRQDTAIKNNIKAVK